MYVKSLLSFNLLKKERSDTCKVQSLGSGQDGSKVLVRDNLERHHKFKEGGAPSITPFPIFCVLI